MKLLKRLVIITLAILSFSMSFTVQAKTIDFKEAHILIKHSIKIIKDKKLLVNNQWFLTAPPLTNFPINDLKSQNLKRTEPIIL